MARTGAYRERRGGRSALEMLEHAVYSSDGTRQVAVRRGEGGSFPSADEELIAQDVERPWLSVEDPEWTGI